MKKNTDVEITALPAELEMFRELADEVADTLCVVEQESHKILYFHEVKKLLPHADDCVGKKCYEVFQGQAAPCPFCNFRNGAPGGDIEVELPQGERICRIHNRATVWNGRPAIIQLFHDVTE